MPSPFPCRPPSVPCSVPCFCLAAFLCIVVCTPVRTVICLTRASLACRNQKAVPAVPTIAPPSVRLDSIKSIIWQWEGLSKAESLRSETEAISSSARSMRRGAYAFCGSDWKGLGERISECSLIGNAEERCSRRLRRPGRISSERNG